MINSQDEAIAAKMKLALGVAGIICLALLAVSLTHPVLKNDEGNYHYPLAVKFAAEFPAIDIVNDYSSAYPPLPYVVAAAVFREFGTNELYARVLNFAVGMATLLSFWIVCRKAGLKQSAWVAGLALLANPYFLRDSLTFFVTLYGILFSIWAFYFLLEDRAWSPLLVCLSLMLAVLSHQWAAACYAAVAAWWLYDFFVQRESLLPRLRKLAFRGGAMAVSLVPPALVFLRWGGLVHPTFGAYAIQFRPSNVVFFGILMGFWFWPLAVEGLRKLKPGAMLVAAIVAAVLMPLCPRWSDDLGPGLMPGIIMHATEIPTRLSPSLPPVLRFGLLFAGILAILALFMARKPWTDVDLRVLLFAGSGMLILVFSALVSEKHYLFLLPFLLLLAVPRLRDRRLAAAWLALSGAISVVYYLYWLLLK